MSHENSSGVSLLHETLDGFMGEFYFGFDPKYSAEHPGALSHDAIVSLLNKIGSQGDNPVMACILFQAGIVRPQPRDGYIPYGKDVQVCGGETGWADMRMYAIYQEGQQMPSGEPLALMTVAGPERAPYRCYQDLLVNTWVNTSDLPDERAFVDSFELERDALGHVFTNDPRAYPHHVCVGQETRISRIGHDDPRCDGSAPVTVEELGFAAEDYASPREIGKPRMRLLQCEDFATYDGRPELLVGFAQVFSSWGLEVDEIDMEGGEHYSYQLNASELGKIRKSGLFDGDANLITGILLYIEDRPWDESHEYSEGDYSFYYSNCWGDMTIRLELQKGPVSVTYTLVVLMDIQGTSAHLSKYTKETVEVASRLDGEIDHILASIVDPQESDTNLNEIDEFEYSALLSFVAALADIRK